MIFNKDDIVTLTIDDCGTSGEGIGKVDGYTLFVKDAIIGDVIKAKIIKAKKNYGYGRLMEIIKPSKDRVKPECPVSRQCGGCQILEMSYEAQLKYKYNLVKGNIERIGGISDYELLPVLGMEKPYRYRNKAQYPVGMDKNGNIVTGFYAGRTHSIIECNDCLIGSEKNSAILETIKNWMNKCNIEPYNEKTGSGLVRHILVRTGYHTDECMVCVVVNSDDIDKKAAEILVDMLVKLRSRNINIQSVVANTNKENTNVILGKKCETLYGRGYIEDYIGNIKYQISPLSFFQVNPAQTEVLYGKALEFAGLTGSETVWDMYCGIGTISLFLARKARKVYGVEIVPQAIEDARNNAKINGIENAEFFVGKAEEVVPAFYDEMKMKAAAGDEDAERSIHPDVVVVDPPRKGCDQILLSTIADMQPLRIVYVSCDSATLARDLAILEEEGYKTVKVQPVDQFAHTVHVECVCLLSKKS